MKKYIPDLIFKRLEVSKYEIYSYHLTEDPSVLIETFLKVSQLRNIENRR